MRPRGRRRAARTRARARPTASSPSRGWSRAAARLAEQTRRLLAEGLVDGETAGRLLALAPPILEPARFVHTDLCRDNLVVCAGALRIIDNGSWAVGPAGYDLGRALWRWPMRSDDRARFLDAYELARGAAVDAGGLAFWTAWRRSREPSTASVARWPMRPAAWTELVRSSVGSTSTASSSTRSHPIRRTSSGSMSATRCRAPPPPPPRATLAIDGERLARARRAAACAALGGGLRVRGARSAPAALARRRRRVEALDRELGVLYQVRGDAVEVVAADPGAGRVGWLRACASCTSGRWASVAAPSCTRRRRAAGRARGPRRRRAQSGKSTLLVHLLSGGASYVSNDRVAVDAAGRAVGVPTIVSLRQGTLDRLPGLPPLPAAWRHGWVHRHTLRELAARGPARQPARDSPPSCTPGQIRAWLGAGETRSGRVVAVLFPEIDHGPAPRLVCLPDDEARGRLRAARIAHDDDGLLARGRRAEVVEAPAPPAFICRLGDYPPGGARALLDELGYHLEARVPMRGWDLSRLDGRMMLDPLPWSYDALAAEALRASTAALDLGTGGGERLATLASAAGGTLAATESVPANIELARARLGPLGVAVHARASGAPLPFADASFDLVLSRHAGFRPAEVARVLRPGGRFLTEQTDPTSHNALRAAFGRRLAVAGDLSAACAGAGLVVDECRRVELQRRFTGVDALVAYLAAIPWIVPDFSVVDDLPHLRRLDDGMPLVFPAHYVLLRAHRQ
ncbi:MAG: phosphotransferase [Candidatus Binatia bacterium]